MNPERWQKVKGLFDVALELAPEKREKFLAKACGADDELRLEVENLLVSFDEAENFMDQPAAAEVASLIIEENENTKTGGRIAHYEALRKIGEGGMGEVFLARDTKLGRKVALKILPGNLTADRSRLRRFKQEAQAASALNHPNIITIYEIREFGETHLIATEFVEGNTLRQKMAENLEMSEILDVAVQVASALSVAHGAGVIHRDIKPENIMVRPDGIVKLLDFGLAKLAETSEVKPSDVLTGKLTNPGMVMGTVNYMSPEQAQGKTVDRQTDLWSLGVCLYEMTAGKTPFSGKTVNHTLVAIMEDEPLPIAGDGFIDAELEKIVFKLLEKKPENRYPAANDLLLDLRRLQKLLESELNQTASRHFAAKIKQFSKDRLTWEKSAGNIAPNNLSGQLSPLIGREKEIFEITDLLKRDSVRLLTLTGIGGTGKTRLAQEIAQKMLPEFADGVFFVALAAVRNAEFVAPAIAAALGVKETGGKTLPETLKNFLNEKQILLIIDNFEQVLTAASFFNELLAAAPDLKILVTSRALLRLEVEREFVLSPLDVPSDLARVSSRDLLRCESVRLFAERARGAKPNLSLSDENLRMIGEICRRLDGLPLAIELAAARAKILSLRQIAERLENSLKLLTGGASDLPARQQTMRAAIEWSFDLLEENEKILFRRLSVFAGGFAIESAESVVGDPWSVDSKTEKEGNLPVLTTDVLDGIASLVDKSLLAQKEQADGNSRFRLLEVVREYAQELLEASGESEMMRKNHAAFFLKLAQDAEPHILGKEGAKWLATIEEEHNNFRAAFSWAAGNYREAAVNLAGALRDFWVLRNRLTEGRQWFETALERAEGAPAAARFKLLNGLGQAARYQGDYVAAQKAYQQGLNVGKEVNDLRQIAVSSRGLAAVAKGRGDFTIARKFYEEALPISREMDEKFGIAVSLNALGDLARIEGDFAAARPLFEEALAICRELGNRQGMGCTLNNLGAVAFALGDFAAARARFAEGLKLSQELGEKITFSYSLDGLAALAARGGDAERAAQLAGAAEHLRETLGFETETAERRFREDYLSQLESILDKEKFAELYEQGKKLEIERCVALALQESRDVSLLPSSIEKPIAAPSIAVLPFLILGFAETEEYLGLGLADALITQLSRTQKLTVRPTNAVRNFTDAERDALEIGKKLKTSAVLDGNLQKSGDRLRVTVQLVNVETGATLWADKFSADFTDFFEVQDQIAEQVSRALLLKLSSSEQRQINKRFTENNAAYLEYLKGRHFWEKRDVEGFHRAIEHYKKAIDLDPVYSLAYVGLSDVYCMLGVWGEYSQDEIFPRAQAAALRALEIDENLAEAHASLGRVASVYDWDWEAAEKSYLRAIELNSNCQNAHSWLAKVYILKHRNDEAIEESRIAQRLDPLSPQAEVSLAAAHFYARRYSEGIERYRKAVKNHPDFVPAIFGLGMCLAEKGEFGEAIALQEKAVNLSKNHPLIEGFLAATYAYSGDQEKALEFIEKFKALQDKSLDYTIAAVYARLNEKEKAFEYLEKSFANRYRELSGLSIEPEFDNLRGEPLFNEMLRRVGLEEAIFKQPIEERIFNPAPVPLLTEAQTLAVLPFLTSGLSEAEEYLGLGLADALIMQLSRTRKLAVRPTSAVRGFINTNKNSTSIGHELQVGTVLEGNLQKSGERFRVTVQLINVESNATLWADKFNADFTDFFEVQDQIAEQVSKALLLKLNTSEQAQINKRFTDNNEAYLEYLKGRYFWGKRDVEGFRKAIEHFRRSIDIDPTYARAYSGLADCYTALPAYGESSAKYFPLGRAAARKALEIDAGLAEAHTSLGCVLLSYDWNWQEAESEYRRAISLNPNYATAHWWYGSFLAKQSRFDEALAEIKKALEIDPLSIVINLKLGAILYFARRYDEAVKQHLKTLELAPDFASGHYNLGLVYTQTERFDEAVAEFELAYKLSGGVSYALESLIVAYARAGKRHEALEKFGEFTALAERRYVPPASWAAVYANLGEKDKAFYWLEKAFAERDGNLTDLNVLPEWSVLRGDPRFQNLLRRVGLSS